MTASGPAGSPPSSAAPGGPGAPPGHLVTRGAPPGNLVMPGTPPGDLVTPGVPAPPTGPGVSPPFAAPPVEGRTARMWIALGVAALAVALCCGGGAIALVGLLVTSTQAANEQARAVVGDYFNAVGKRDYNHAYDLLCDDLRERESLREFERRAAAQPQITSYDVGELRPDGLAVPVDVTYASGTRATLRVTLAQDTGTGALEVCGVS